MTTISPTLIPPAIQPRAAELLQAAHISSHLCIKAMEASPQLTIHDIEEAHHQATLSLCKLNALRSMLRGNQLPRSGE